MNHHFLRSGVLLSTALSLSSLACAQTVISDGAPVANTPDALAAGFTTPPQAAGIRCFWWWLNGNVTRQSITRDLEQMKAKGFSGALIFDADGASQFGNNPVPVGPSFGSPAWRALFKHAVTEADRLGLVLSLSIQSGWNLGGPDVSAAESSKILTWSEQDVGAGTNGAIQLASPAAKEGFYRDIAVLAFPIKSAIPNAATSAPKVSASTAQNGFAASNVLDQKPETFWVSAGARPGEGPTAARPEALSFAFETPVSLGSARITGRVGYGPKSGEFQASDDGKTFRTLKRFSSPTGDPVTVQFEPTQAAYFRLVVLDAADPGSPNAPRNVQISEIALLAPDGTAIAGANNSIKAGAAPVQNLRAKAVFSELGGSATDTRFLLDDVPAKPGEEDARLADVINISDKMQADGTLRWTPPQGRVAGQTPVNWHVMRFGYTISGAKVSTASGTWQGLVVDHLSAPILRRYWAGNIAPLLDDIGPLAGKTLKYVHTDSWELGGANWTEGFDKEFRSRRGYDPLRYLPIVAGKILDNREVGTRFLADLRKTIGDCVTDNHYHTMSELSHARGMGIHPESAGPHAGPFDGIKNYGQSDLVLSEFWAPSPHRPTPVSRFFVKQASSAAHIYNKRLVGAEGFTTVGPQWNDTLWQAQKPSFDHEVCAGLNIVFAHTFTSSPPEMGLPGQEYFAGTHFNPQVTWWDMAGAYTAYMDRNQFVMQQGQVVCDALYYYGDHVPNIAAFKESDPAKVLPGFDYDVMDEEVLLRSLQVKNGLLTLPHGPTYRVLVLPDHKVLSLAVLRKVEALVRAGATVIGPKTERTASLVEFPQSEVEVTRRANNLWGQTSAPTGQNRLGKGRVIWGQTARQVLISDGIAPDFEIQNAAPDAVFDSIHRRIGSSDVYFVSNQSAQPQSLNALFRTSGKAPELWDALTGERRMATAFTQSQNRTGVPLELGAYGSILVVFNRAISPTTNGTTASNARPVTALATLSGPWNVGFDPKWGAPASVRFDKLESWLQRPEEGVKNYSGTAIYRSNFPVAEGKATGRLLLELGDVRDIGIARVRVNGQDCGITWTPPFRVDISRAAKAGNNSLEIEVPNSWRNRLVADRELPVEKRFTKTNIAVKPDWKRVDSGLLGPVRVLREAP